eukprot:TCONS_00033497-protein
MEVKIQVLVPIVVVLVLLVIAVTVILCRFYLWKRVTKRKQHKYSKLQASRRNTKAPIAGSETPPFFFQQEEQTSRYSNKWRLSSFDANSNQYKAPYNQYDFNKLNAPKKKTTADSNSDASGELFHFDDGRSTKSSGSEYDGSYPDSTGPPLSASKPRKLTSGMKKRFVSEPILNKDFEKAYGAELKRKRFHAKRAKSKISSVVTPALGQVEFSLIYEPSDKSLTIHIAQLSDIQLRPECFLGLLDVIDRGSDFCSMRKDGTTIHLIRNADNTLELAGYGETAFLLYVTLLPKKRFCKSTETVLGEDSAVFNEKFKIHGHTHEQLSNMYLCIHALCKFGRECDPIVLGEVKVPLKRLQPSHLLPFMANLALPEEEVIIESHLQASNDLGFLEVYVSYNPMTQTLVVKVIQATNLPKSGMTGHPNVSVKASLYYCNQRLSKKTTSIQKRDRNPVFNETFEFELSKERLPECDVLFEIRHHGPMSRGIIGYVIVGASAGGEGTKQWRQLLDFSYHEQSYKIKPNKPAGLP